MKSKTNTITGMSFFAFFFCCTSFLFAEPGKPIQLKDNLFNVDFVNETHGWAVGYYGRILHTSDGGNSWEYQKSGTEKLLAGVDFVDPNNGWVVGYGPTILRTADGGKTWSEQKIEDEDDVYLTAVHFLSEKKGWAVGEWGTILYTEDGGATWVKQLSGNDAVLYCVDFADELNGWTAGEFGTIFHTEDGGKTWLEQPSGVENVFFSCKVLDAAEAWLTGIDSLVLHTRDGGATWETVDTGIKKITPFYQINFRDRNKGMVCGQGVALLTENGGSTWGKSSMLEGIEYIWLYDVAYASSQNAWMVGEKGKIFKSEDDGKTWKEITY